MSGDDFLRDAVSRAGDGIAGGVPSDLAGNLEARRTRIVRRRTATRVLAGAAAVVLVGAIALQFAADDEDAVETIDVPTTPTSAAPTTVTSSVTTDTTAPDDTTTSSTTQQTTTTQPTTTTPAPTVSPIGTTTPLSLYGIGAVRAGMTIAEAEAATGQALVIRDFDFAEGSCYFANIDGIEDLLFLITSDAGPTGDPRQGTIGRVTVSTSGRTTISGIGVGSSREDVLETYGDRITETPHMYVTDGSYLDYTSPDPADDGFAVRFEVTDGSVRDIHAGRWPEYQLVEGCA